MHRQNTCVWKRWVRKSINNNKHQTKHTKCKSKSYLHLLITVSRWRMTLILTKSDLLLISKMFILIQLDKANSLICFKIFNSPKRTLLFCFQSQKPLRLSLCLIVSFQFLFEPSLHGSLFDIPCEFEVQWIQMA